MPTPSHDNCEFSELVQLIGSALQSEAAPLIFCLKMNLCFQNNTGSMSQVICFLFMSFSLQHTLKIVIIFKAAL